MLHIVPTPIGNLEDITIRAIKILENSDLIIAENAKKTKILLNKYDITCQIYSCNVVNEQKKMPTLIKKIQSLKNVSLVSDAGTPGISDPGFLLIRECISLNIPISCLPGPTALIPALIQSGFACEKFVFEGFLPRKKKKKRLEFLATENRTIIIYESPYRLLKTLHDLNIYFQDRNIVVVKELTKIYENIYRGDINSVIADLENLNIKGEYIIVIQGLNN
jgi:16S rRNA (cytidine1402-2'-O)-methyltransferase